MLNLLNMRYVKLFMIHWDDRKLKYSSKYNLGVGK